MNAGTTAKTLRIGSAVLISALIFFPSVLGEIASVRLWAIGIGLVAFAIEVVLTKRSVRARVLTVIGAAVATGTFLAVIELIAVRLDARAFAVNGEHLLILLPLFAATGVQIMRSGMGKTYLTVGISAATLVALLALVEFAGDFSVLGREYTFLTSQREGPTRALVGSEHVLVLGATLAAFVPLTSVIQRAPLRLTAGAVILLGTWASGSRVPAAIATLVFLVQSVPVVKRFIVRNTRYLVLLAAVATAALAICATFVWSPYIGGESGLDFSANYRFASYAVLPQILLTLPLGYLLVGAPAGAWVVGSESRGQVDLGMSADSELLYAAFTLGWVGVLVYLIVLLGSLRTLQESFAVGAAASSIAVMGFSLALHGWDGMSNLWYLLIGACAYLLHRQHLARRARPPQHLHRHGTSIPGQGAGSTHLSGQILDGVTIANPKRWSRGTK
ncbi:MULTISPECIES: hypothetical protein [unclassified Cryobacterium]|uniref:hypothetical protein n=1 Tax=unclassified Cryobacterium TaxID=2649013 RepID=UPI00106DD2B2|nr:MULTISPECIES: hypothetical protein [unclassified Cryobacterium]TFC56971.1 hypothetical protein E3O68_03075 [Cryobacterium sp. TMB3-1-2]TFC67928.1 hypothetical protein E3T21_15875 [Cryobacterium sp. TMB3-15]TFC76847.1 hypothetical protein E3T22_07785 [Cryobacterium sp. TMB3-10]TFD42264.1 hypothetical protein E3T58_09370 [Cryobacterium sp. TMB3-12]